MQHIALGKVVDVQEGVDIDKHYRLLLSSDQNVAYYSVADICSGNSELLPPKPIKTVSNIGINKFGGSILPPGSVVFQKYSLGDENPSIHILNEPAAISSGLIALVPKGAIDPRYLFYWLLQFDLRRSANMKPPSPSVDISKLKNIELPVPDQVEQLRIVDTLDCAYSLSAKIRELDKIYTNLILIKFIEVFGDPLRNPLAWPVVSLHSILESVQPHAKGTLSHRARNLSRHSQYGRSIGFRKSRNGLANAYQPCLSTNENNLIVHRGFSICQGTHLYLEGPTGSDAYIFRTRESFGCGYVFALLSFSWLTDLLSARSKQARYLENPQKNILDLKLPYPASKQLHREFDVWVKRVEKIRALHRESETIVNRLFFSILHRIYSGEPLDS